MKNHINVTKGNINHILVQATPNWCFCDEKWNNYIKIKIDTTNCEVIKHKILQDKL